MEWLTSLWSKLNKPLHFLFVGITFIFFAPSTFSWLGYVFISLGLARVLEWGWGKFCKWYDYQKSICDFEKSLSYLNKDEKHIILEQLKKGEQTFYLNWHDYYQSNYKEYRRLTSIFLGLSHKHILSVKTDDTSACLNINNFAWNILQKKKVRLLLEK